MNSKFFMLAGCLLLTAGCSQSVNVAKTDIPEDDMIASQPVVIQPDQKMVKMTSEEVGYTDTIKKTVKRGIASEDGGEAMALGGNSDPENNERTAEVDGVSPMPEKEDAEMPPAKSSIAALLRSDRLVPSRSRLVICNPNTVTNVQNILASQGIETAHGFVGVGESVPRWLNAGYRQLSRNEPTHNNDVCIYSGGSKDFGTIFVKHHGKFTDGCSVHTGIPSMSHYHLKGCFRPPTKKA